MENFIYLACILGTIAFLKDNWQSVISSTVWLIKTGAALFAFYLFIQLLNTPVLCAVTFAVGLIVGVAAIFAS